MFGGRKPAKRLYLAAGLVLAALLAVPAANFYYEYGEGKACARCHEIWQPYKEWTSSAHRQVACQACHGDVLTLEAGFHLKNISRLVSHLRGSLPEQIPAQTGRRFSRCGTLPPVP